MREPNTEIGRAILEETFSIRFTCRNDCNDADCCIDRRASRYDCGYTGRVLSDSQYRLCRLAIDLYYEGHYKTARDALKALVKK